MRAAAELFIQDLAATGWDRCCADSTTTRPAAVLLDSKLRASLSEYDHFDFLVDLAPPRV